MSGLNITCRICEDRLDIVDDLTLGTGTDVCRRCAGAVEQLRKPSVWDRMSEETREDTIAEARSEVTTSEALRRGWLVARYIASCVRHSASDLDAARREAREEAERG